MFWFPIAFNERYPCNENRGKIDDFIAILEPINCALYRDRSRFRQKSVFNHDLIGDFFLENRDKIAIKSSKLMIFWGWEYSHQKWQSFDKIDGLTSYDITLSMSSKIPWKWAILSRFSSRLIVRFYRDKIVKIGNFPSVFFKKTLIHKDFDEIIICSPQYNRRFF